MNECSPTLLSTHCLHGKCTNTVGGYHCECDRGFIGSRCSMANPCEPEPGTNQTLHNCAHGRCVRPTVVRYIGREVAQHECECLDGYAGSQCTILVPQQQRSIGLGYVLGLGITVVVTLSILGMLLFCFAAMRNKRASHGHYSPSSQEMAGARTEHVSIAC